MRDFFKKEVLDRTYEIFGSLQTAEDKMSADDVKYLLDGLCQVSKTYGYIPEEDQKKIIKHCMLTDMSYRNINLRLVSGWLELNGKKFYTELAHKETTEQPTPVEGEEREKWLKIWEQTLKQVEQTYPSQRVKGNGQRMKEKLDEAGVKFDEEKHKEETIVRKESSSLDDFVNKVGDYAEEKSLEGNNTDETKTDTI